MSKNFCESDEDLCERFKIAFARIERALRKEHIDIEIPNTAKLNRKSKIAKAYYLEINDFREIRNINSHPDGKHRHMVVPHIGVVERAEEIAEKLDPKKKIQSVFVPQDKIFSASMDDRVLDVSKTMIEKIYTHVPILDERGSLVGIFSESSVFNYFAQEEDTIADKGIKISELDKFLEFKNRDNEKFAFVKRSATYQEVKNLFLAPLQSHQRLGAVFITENGKSSETIMGMVTAWDMLKG